MPPRDSPQGREEVGGSPDPFPDEEVCSGDGLRAVGHKTVGPWAPRE